MACGRPALLRKAPARRGLAALSCVAIQGACVAPRCLGALPVWSRGSLCRRSASAAAGPLTARSASSTDAAQPRPQKSGTLRQKGEPIPRSSTPRLAPPRSGRTLKVVSINLAGLRSRLTGPNSEKLRALVEREEPDILCLNEHKLQDQHVPKAEADLRDLLPGGYNHMHWSVSKEKKGYSGVAMLLRDTAAEEEEASSTPALVEPGKYRAVEGLPTADAEDPIAQREGRLLALELPELYVVSVYVPNSGARLDRLAYRVGSSDEGGADCWDRALGRYLSRLQETKPVLLIGDMNVAHDVRDIWNMHDRPDFPEPLASAPLAEQYSGLKAAMKSSGLTPEERESFQRLLSEAGLVDTFRRLHPEALGAFSYFSQRAVQNRPRNQGLRLDYVLASACMCERLRPRRTSGPPSDDAGDVSSAPEPALASPQVLDSFILDEDELVADHAAVGCYVSLSQ